MSTPVMSEIKSSVAEDFSITRDGPRCPRGWLAAVLPDKTREQSCRAQNVLCAGLLVLPVTGDCRNAYKQHRICLWLRISFADPRGRIAGSGPSSCIYAGVRRVMMNRVTASTCAMQPAIRAPRGIHMRVLFIVAAVLAAVVPAIAQMGPELQQKITALKESTAENQQKLHRYQWTETTQLTLNGDAKPPTQQMCQYGPDGTVQKFAMGPPPAPPSGGRLKQ